MAKIHPSHREPDVPSEGKVLNALRSLDDDWHVFHGIKWQGVRRNRQADGETDFALFHPTNGILVIEAKGGEVNLVEGQFLENRKGERLDPFEQAAAGKRHMSDFLAAHVDGLGGGPRVGHAVAFPDIGVEGDLGPDGPRAIILDRHDLADVPRTLARLSSHWRPPQRLTSQQIGRIRSVLLPTRTIKRTLGDQVSDASAAILELTEAQYEILDGLQGKRQALIYGGAGTGKTILAIERVRRLADLGASVLFVCFNQLLGRHLAHQFRNESLVTAGTFHQVARKLAVDARRMIPEDPPQHWWVEELPTLFPEVAIELGFEVEAVVVDEGQDFHHGWWDPLRLVLRDFDDGWFYVFADPQQSIHQADWKPPLPTPDWTLWKNCRNTDPIAVKAAAVVGSDIRPNSVDGPKPKFHVVRSKDAAVERILDRLAEMIDGGLTPNQIQVLVDSRGGADRLLGRDVAGVGLVDHGDDGLAVETVHRFKGLESDAVVLWLSAEPPDPSLVYTGMTRAISMLEVVGTEATMQAINWSG